MADKQKIMSWKDAFFASPGPESLKESVVLTLKGVCMGAADIIPGVSGGTIALITGIYEKLLWALKSADATVAKKLINCDIKGAIADLHFRFLLFLFIGISTSIISLAGFMNYFLHYHPVEIWSLFFGLITASIFTVGRYVQHWTKVIILSFITGTISAYLIVGLVPASTPETLWFIFFSGLIAICAMILPGLSGAFILLILGKYEFITAALKNPFLFCNMIVICVFCCGCFVGLIGFSRALNFMLRRYRSLTLAFLTGLMTGSIKKIWPWKEIIETKIIREKIYVLADRNILPQSFGTEFFIAVSLILIGFAVVIFIVWVSKKV
ncbi:Polyprenyl-phosphate transporter [Candidatus Magnetomoraceae bacterium gMMP-1]